MLYSGDDFYDDEITSGPNTINPLAREDERPLEKCLNARTQIIQTPEGRRYIAQVNLNGDWHDVVDYRAIGRMEHTKREARQNATNALRTMILNWEN